MKVPQHYYDTIFEFKGQWDMPSSCGLTVTTVDGVPTVIVTELYQENPGTSVTYAGASLRDQVCAAHGIDPAAIRYIECTPDTNSKLSFYDEEFYEVDFNAQDPAHRYTRLTPGQVDALRRSHHKN